MEDGTSSQEKPPAKTQPVDTIMAYVMGGLIVAWLVAYAYFALRAWIGRP